MLRADAAALVHRARRALEGEREVLGPRHPSTLNSVNNLASLLKKQGKYDEAEPLYREALKVWRETLGDRHPLTLAYMNNLGNLLQDMGDAANVHEWFREFCETNEPATGVPPNESADKSRSAKRSKAAKKPAALSLPAPGDDSTQMDDGNEMEHDEMDDEKKEKGTWEPGKPGRPPNWYKYGIGWNGK